MQNDIPEELRPMIDAALRGEPIEYSNKDENDWHAFDKGSDAVREMLLRNAARTYDFRIQKPGIKGYLALIEMNDGSRRWGATVYHIFEAAKTNELARNVYMDGDKLVGIQFIELDPETNAVRNSEFTELNIVRGQNPDTIFVDVRDTSLEHHVEGVRVIAVKRGEKGYYKITTSASVDTLNGGPMPKDVIDSAIGASMFGWEAPIAQKALEWLDAKATA
jgi:hypothetical protein